MCINIHKVYIYIYIYMQVYMMYVHENLYIYTYTHTHTHTFSVKDSLTIHTEQLFSTIVLLISRRHLETAGDILVFTSEHCFWLLLNRLCFWHLVAGMPLNLLQWTGWPPITKNYLTHIVNRTFTDWTFGSLQNSHFIFIL